MKDDIMMNKIITLIILVLLFFSASCTQIQDERPDPLVLPYSLFEQEFRGTKVKITLQPSNDGPTPYEFLMTAQTAPGQTQFGVYVITVVLTEGYQQNKQVDWFERIGEQPGTGGLWEGESLDAQELTSSSAYGVGNTGEIPVAVFVRIVAGDTDGAGTVEKTFGPVAILQILPEAQGVIRLDQ
jgi:hypothetical protein